MFGRMNGERPPIRVFGQRSISSSFLSGSSNPFKSSSEGSQRKSSKGSQLSLSDFLDQKLPETSVPQRTVKGKSSPFASLQGPRDSNSSINRPIGSYCGADTETESAISKVIFEQFKRPETNQGECLVSGSAIETDISDPDDILESRKRKKSNEGFSIPCSESQKRKKNVVVLGGGPKPEQKGKEAIHIRNRKPGPLYNHYASGSGWWDCNMEGVDSEEVGLGEVWEGVGSTTLGGIEWH
ncbi:uncharacterized protein LOC111008529 [Momordica charantia]|uniref:Uncharacterized protein LOC111008529 n=1 Tax=Momordica charantia TaxID=3673 RepID=A0A6J1C6W9_MOMCH|nr:uncharacterized protein LOC111008529 [Momordica charantia]XP_022136968.1 uncharacterized protein LOC111008529 [Momordica charantia]XP_022136973.1 uncharacterized protein LOC111008529 [Momordica charantia]